MLPNRLRVLSIASACPAPPVGGTRILIHQQLQAIAAHHDVDSVMVDCPSEVDCDLSSLPHCRSARLIAIPEPEREFDARMKLWLTARSRAPFFVYQRYSQEAQRVVDQLTAKHSYDLIIAEDNEAGLYVRRAHPGRKLLSKHSILSIQRRQLAQLQTSSVARTRDRLYSRMLASYERREAVRFDMIKLPTQADLRHWREIVGASPTGFAVTNGVDTDYFRYTSRHGSVDRLLFTANFSGVQNIDAALRLADAIHPLVMNQLAPMPLFLVGKSPPNSLRQRASANVVVTGTVADVRPYYAGKPIAVLPLKIASGIINKVLEPMAMGVPVVATRIAVEGLDTDTPARLCMIADTPEEFVAAIVALCRDDDLYQRLAIAARDYVSRHHSWPELMARYRTYAERLVTRSSNRTAA